MYIICYKIFVFSILLNCKCNPSTLHIFPSFHPVQFVAVPDSTASLFGCNFVMVCSILNHLLLTQHLCLFCWSFDCLIASGTTFTHQQAFSVAASLDTNKQLEKKILEPKNHVELNRRSQTKKLKTNHE
jgi:hypothetical protein